MAATVTYNLADELQGQSLAAQGHDGYIVWQSAFLLNDGRICAFGTGNHNPNQSNAMRIIDPISSPGTVSSYNDFPWTQDIDPRSFADPGTPHDLYADNYDNHPSIYIPSENKAVWLGHGVFDFTPGVKSWIYGNRPPNVSNWNVFLADSLNANTYYNPCVGWSHELNMGILYGNGNGGLGQGDNQCTLIKRRPAGSPTAWITQLTSVAGVNGCHNNRHGGVVVGEYFYLDSGDLGTRAFYKIHLPTMTLAASLTPCTRVEGGQATGGDYFWQMVYDQRRRKIVMIGDLLQEFDVFGTQTWTNITPVGWPGFQAVRGVYHPKLDAIFFSGWLNSGGTNQNSFQWHRITFEGTGGSNYRQIDIDSTLCPFKGPPEEGFGGSKHTFFAWHPVKRRVYTWGGDYGNGASAFGQPNMGASFTTNQPTGAQTYSRDSSLCNDQYSIDPYAVTATVPWRLEHPYLPRNLGGTREERPGRPDQVWLMWDPLRSKFWGLIHVLRTEFMTGPAGYIVGGQQDLWANGNVIQSPLTPDATWSWTPGASGSPGTWVKESANRLNYIEFSGTSYSGGVLNTGLGDQRVGGWSYYPGNDCYACLSAVQGGQRGMFFFKPATITYEYRLIPNAGYNRVDCSASFTCIIGDWIYAVAIATETGGTRRSLLIRVNLRNALAVANGGTISASDFQTFTLPWSLSPGATWESANDGGAKWQEHAGVMALNGKVAIVKSYDGILEDTFTKLTIFSPDTLSFSAAATAPEDIWANSWCALPESGEVLFGLNTSAGAYTNLKMWAYADRLVSGGADGIAPTVSVTAPADAATVSGTVTVSATASDNVGVVGVQFTLDGVNLQSEDLTAPYSISWDTLTASSGSHVLRAVARDAAGNTTTSAPITVTVSNGSAPAAPQNLRRVL